MPNDSQCTPRPSIFLTQASMDNEDRTEQGRCSSLSNTSSDPEPWSHLSPLSPISPSPSSIEMQTFLKNVHNDEEEEQEPGASYFSRPRYSIRSVKGFIFHMSLPRHISSYSTNNLPSERKLSVKKRNSSTMFPGPYSSMASLMMRTSRTSSNIVNRRRHFGSPRQKQIVSRVVDAWSSISDPQSTLSYTSVGAPGPQTGHKL